MKTAEIIQKYTPSGDLVLLYVPQFTEESSMMVHNLSGDYFKGCVVKTGPDVTFLKVNDWVVIKNNIGRVGAGTIDYLYVHEKEIDGVL